MKVNYDELETIAEAISVLRWHAIPLIEQYCGEAPARPVIEIKERLEKLIGEPDPE